MEYQGIRVFYKGQQGEGTPIVLLHGWGASSAAMDGIYNFLLAQGRTVYAFDFPGFGHSDAPPDTWGIHEYADCIRSLLQDLHLNSPVLVGHSFGGRVAILLGASGCVSKLILADAAGCKPRFSLKKRLAVARYKRAVRRGLRTDGYGSADYRALSPAMRKVFVRVVNTHLESYLSQIKVPTLLFWGKNDTDTPLYMAKRLKRKIKDSGLVVMEDAGHFAYAERHAVFCAAVNAFTERNGERK
ncbi:MAG: alpha/beta hydrolase [Clostridiales bacterium]|nr:alpha/beta hydrolase [Clostridiales bacterium]